MRMISLISALLLTFLGLMVMIGWIFHMPILIQVSPKYVGMVFNTAFLFCLAGLCLTLNNLLQKQTKNLLVICGLILILFSCVAMLQTFFNFNYINIDNLFINPWLHDPNPTPGRMAPNTSVAFILTGIVLIFLPIYQKKFITFSLPIIIFIIFLTSMLGALVYSLNLEYVFSWHQFTRMAIHTALGFFIMSVMLLTYVLQLPAFRQYFEDKADRKVIFISGAVLIVVTLITSIGSVAFLTASTSRMLQQAFMSVLDNEIIIFNESIQDAQNEIYNAVKLPMFKSILKNTLKERQQADFQQVFSNDDYTVYLYGKNNELLYSKKTLKDFGVNYVDLNLKIPAMLFWYDGFWIRLNTGIYENHNYLGRIIIEVPLTLFNDFYKGYKNLGATGENVLCKQIEQNLAKCFPTRKMPKMFQIPLIINNKPLPILFAFKNERGAILSHDYRGEKVFAAYGGLVGGLGLVSKIDTAELYEPINRQLITIIPGALILILLGLLLLRWQVVPLVKKVIESEKEAKQSKLDLIQSEEKFKLAVNSSNTGLWDWDIHGTKVFYSDIFKSILGYGENEVPNKISFFIKSLYPEDKDRVLGNFKNAIAHLKPIDMELRLRQKNGNYGWYRSLAQVITDGENKPKRVAGSLLDINARKKVEALKNEFVSMVSHELRTPLTSIKGALSLILGGATGVISEQSKNLLEIASKNCDRLINLINDILDVEKIESGRMKFDLKEISINTVVEEAVSANIPFADKFQVTIKTYLANEQLFVSADNDRLIQVMTNLLSNAIKFSPKHSDVIIKTMHLKDWLRVEVKDEGPGVPEEFMSQIFQKFSQADSSSSRKIGGTGLGLNITKAIIESLHGKIDFYNNDTKGATFYFELPLIGSRNHQSLHNKSSLTSNPHVE